MVSNVIYNILAHVRFGLALRPYAEHAHAALHPRRGQAYFDDACPLSRSVDPLQLRFDARLFRFGKLPSDP